MAKREKHENIWTVDKKKANSPQCAEELHKQTHVTSEISMRAAVSSRFNL